MTAPCALSTLQVWDWLSTFPADPKEVLMGVITISRQMGSEGTYIGKKLAKELGLSYVDKQELGKIM